MDRKLINVLLSIVGVIVFFVLIVLIGGAINSNLKLSEAVALRWLFVVIGSLIAFAIYFVTRTSQIWEVGTREVVFMAIGAALYAIFSYLFNGTVFVVPSVSQVALRPAICIPMFFGYIFGPVVGFFTGAVGNMFGDAITGFGLSPQWSIGNGLIGLIAGLALLFKDKKRSTDVVLIVSGVIALLGVLLYALTKAQAIPNMVFFNPPANIFGDQPITLFAGISGLVGLVLVLIVRFAFGKNFDLAAAVVWGMLGNFLGLGFAALSDIWINQYKPSVAFVGEFLPSAGPNLIFAAILVPALVAAYAAVRRQSGR